MVKSIEIPDFTLGVVLAGADLRLKQYHAVKLNSSGAVILAGAGEAAIGFLRNKPNTGAVAEVMCSGVALAYVGAAAVTAGDEIMSDASGQVTTHTGTNSKIGVAMQTGANTEIVSILLLTRSGIGSSANRSIMTIPVTLANLANGDFVTDMIPGFAGVIEKFYFVTGGVPASTASKAATLNLEIEATNVTGGVISLTTAACDTIGKVAYGTAITALNAFTAAEKISVEVASVTTFAEGTGFLCLVLKNS